MVANERQHLVFTGGSKDFFSPYATTSSLSFKHGSYKVPGQPTVYGPSSSGYSNAYFRDAPPPSAKHDSPRSSARESYVRPHTATLEESGFAFDSYAPKDFQPLKTCLKRGEIKEPRFHPFKMGSEHGAHALITPQVSAEQDYATRFAAPAPAAHGAVAAGAEMEVMSNKGVKPESGFSLGNSQGRALKAMITARQGQEDFRPPSYTRRQEERVAADSTRRFFFHRDHYEQPFLSSAAYFQNDAASALRNMRQRGESLTVAANVLPASQYALETPPVPFAEPPFAPDIDSSWEEPERRLRAPPAVASVAATLAAVPLDEQKLPTGFTRIRGLTTDDAGPEEPSAAPPLPERFRRERARRDHLKWGGELEDRFRSVARTELCAPAKQAPLGGARTEMTRVVTTDHSGYHMQVTQAPIVHDVW